MVQRLALEKAVCAYRTFIDNPGLPVLGADTVVEINGLILGKPESRAHARKMLQTLSGHKHSVHTSVALVTGDRELMMTNSSAVTFRKLEDREIDSYLETGEADDKAGSYAIQGRAAQFVTNISGSYSGIMGLPLYETALLLKQCGINPLARILHEAGGIS
jgi:septum formation protein